MPAPRFKPGEIREAIMASLRARGEASVTEILADAEAKIGRAVPSSSVRSYLNLNVPKIFIRVAHGHYKLARP